MLVFILTVLVFRFTLHFLTFTVHFLTFTMLVFGFTLYFLTFTVLVFRFTLHFLAFTVLVFTVTVPFLMFASSFLIQSGFVRIQVPAFCILSTFFQVINPEKLNRSLNKFTKAPNKKAQDFKI